MIKQPRSGHEVISFAEAVKRFGMQVATKSIKSQRPHYARIAAGKAKHINKVCPTQSTLEAVIRVVRGVPMPMDLVNGYHRMAIWMKDGCPFEDLNLLVHTVNADSDVESEDMRSAVKRTIDSGKSAQDNADFFTAAVLDAGLTPTSNAYKLGTRALTLFKRVVGNPEYTADRLLTESFVFNRDVHILMDGLYKYTENRANMSAAEASNFFCTGVAEAIFDYFKNRPSVSISGVNTALILKDAFALACENDSVNEAYCAPAAVLLAQTLKTVCVETNLKKLKEGHNVEQFYDAMKKAFEPSLSAFDALVPKKHLAAI